MRDFLVVQGCKELTLPLGMRISSRPGNQDPTCSSVLQKKKRELWDSENSNREARPWCWTQRCHGCDTKNAA